jgi:hypothetical protein
LIRPANGDNRDQHQGQEQRQSPRLPRVASGALIILFGGIIGILHGVVFRQVAHRTLLFTAGAAAGSLACEGPAAKAGK